MATGNKSTIRLMPQKTIEPPYYEVKYQDIESGQVITEQIQADNVYIKDGTASFTEQGVVVHYVAKPIHFRRVDE